MDHQEPPADALIGDAAAALFRLGRLFSRSAGPAQGARHTDRAAALSHILIVQAVEAAQADAAPDITVGMVAQQLAVEPSTASRLVADATREGYVARRLSPLDSRRVHLELTDAGRALAADARQYQREVFHEVTRSWTDAERREFARLFVQFAGAVTVALRTPATPPELESPHESGAYTG